jgi:hypothetical protein
MGEPDNFPQLASPAISKAPFENDRPANAPDAATIGWALFRSAKIAEPLGPRLPMTGLRLHGGTDMGHSLSPDISRYILPYSDSVGITAWRLI